MVGSGPQNFPMLSGQHMVHIRRSQVNGVRTWTLSLFSPSNTLTQLLYHPHKQVGRTPSRPGGDREEPSTSTEFCPAFLRAIQVR